MTVLHLEDASGPAPAFYRGVIDLLGGSDVLRELPVTPLDAHDLILRGLPAAALTHLVDGLEALRDRESLEKAVGMSLRTFQRKKGGGPARLSQEQSGRTWRFAEILAKAAAVFGSREDAEGWLERPALGLDGRRPLDLLATPAGVRLVDDHLERLRYGVYA